MDELTVLISKLQRQLEGLQAALPYADGQQHYRDKDKIAELKESLSYWNRVKMIVERFDNKGSQSANDDRSLAANEGVPQLLRKQSI